MPMATFPNVVAIEEAMAQNVIETRWFLPFTIHRLQPVAINRIVTFELVLQNVLDEPLTIQPLRLTWSLTSENIRVPPVQEHIITEWAACGIACVIVPLVTKFQILQVTQSGDSFDYWVGDNI